MTDDVSDIVDVVGIEYATMLAAIGAYFGVDLEEAAELVAQIDPQIERDR